MEEVSGSCGDLAGLLLFCPIILAALNWVAYRGLNVFSDVEPLRIKKISVVVAVSAAIAVLSVALTQSSGLATNFVFLSVVPVIIAGALYGLSGGLISLLVTALVIVGSAGSIYPEPNELLEFHVFLTTLAAMAIFIGSFTDDRRRREGLLTAGVSEKQKERGTTSFFRF